MKILVTGGAGFIGSAVVRYIIKHTPHYVINIDKLTYAANPKALENISYSEKYIFEKVDICSHQDLDRVFKLHHPNAVIHLAAESHVDRSIVCPSIFIKNNILGTFTLLEVIRNYLIHSSKEIRNNFRFIHVSTDEVYGELKACDIAFNEYSCYAPSSPYSASKASSDHLVSAWCRTYGIPTIITHSTNNYGPYQHEEKLIPSTITNAIAGKPIQIYGKGLQIRDWIYVEDTASALYFILMNGKIGETYNIGANNEINNLDIVTKICSILDTYLPIQQEGIGCYKELIRFVSDRPGHDFRYAIDSSKIRQLGWKPKERLDSGLIRTIKFFSDI
ncbi:dTDP-glucose 4,6-dehydratase [Gilliamella apicola]|uniref:dTDP-glucose 4,6-dehydratase n=1 Tax=Gilliamella apicola TaxID=1196095 RepID=A0A2V4E3Z4_9GAMM|nr:dTDP-glucose 4,6-dehydratase [Gilliamella apicola]PXZ05891.1 dTDP-glucose 4,6-dehydratase [Gilliamella apicola]